MSKQPFNMPSFPVKVPRRVGKARPRGGTPWGLLVLVLLLHGVMGLLLSVFLPPFWVWPLALAGTLVQTSVLAGPRALSSLQGMRILLSRGVTCLGVALSVVALAIAVGYGGTADIDDIQFVRTGLVLLLINLGVLVLTALCSLLIANIGDRLLAEMSRTRCSLYLLSFCFLGLVIGGALGLAIAS